MLHLELQPDLEAQLAQEAQSHGLPLDRYIEQLVEARPIPAANTISAAEAVVDIRELRKGVQLDGLRIKDLIEEGRRF